MLRFEDGKLHYEKRLRRGGQGFSGSPVAAGEYLYFTWEQGDVFVLAATGKVSVLATNRLGGISLSTPALFRRRPLFSDDRKMLAIGFNRNRAPFNSSLSPGESEGVREAE